MQAASVSCGKEITAVASHEGDGGGGGEEEEEEEVGEGVFGQESRREDEELKKETTPGQVHGVSMEVQPRETDAGASTVSGEYH